MGCLCAKEPLGSCWTRKFINLQRFLGPFSKDSRQEMWHFPTMWPLHSTTDLMQCFPSSAALGPVLPALLQMSEGVMMAGQANGFPRGRRGSTFLGMNGCAQSPWARVNERAVYNISRTRQLSEVALSYLFPLMENNPSHVASRAAGQELISLCVSFRCCGNRTSDTDDLKRGRIYFSPSRQGT